MLAERADEKVNYFNLLRRLGLLDIGHALLKGPGSIALQF